MNLKIGKAIDYDIVISPSSNFGFTVKVGCGRFVAASVDDLIDGLKQFLQMPDVFMKEYNGIPGNVPQQTESVDVPHPQNERMREMRPPGAYTEYAADVAAGIARR